MKRNMTALRPSELPFVTATSKQDQQAIDRILLDEPGIYQGDRETFIRKWFAYKDSIPEWEKYAAMQPV